MRSSLALLSVVFASALAGCWEMSEVSYKDVEEARKASAIGESKWLPEWLPEGAHDIREAHDVDTNQSWLSFRLGTPLSLPSSCSRVESLELMSSKEVSRFPGFVQDSHARVEQLKGEFYECAEGGSIRWVAIDGDARRVYSGVKF